MISSTAATVLGLVLTSVGVQASTPLVRTYQGDSFFDRWVSPLPDGGSIHWIG